MLRRFPTLSIWGDPSWGPDFALSCPLVHHFLWLYWDSRSPLYIILLGHFQVGVRQVPSLRTIESSNSVFYLWKTGNLRVISTLKQCCGNFCVHVREAYFRGEILLFVISLKNLIGFNLLVSKLFHLLLTTIDSWTTQIWTVQVHLFMDIYQ